MHLLSKFSPFLRSVECSEHSIISVNAVKLRSAVFA